MALRDTVVRYAGIGIVKNNENMLMGTTPLGDEYPVPVSCHFATCYWLITEVAGVEPDLNRMFDITPNPTGAVEEMVAQGARKMRPAASLSVPTGSIVVFVKNGVAEHSCTAIDPIYAMGYNQIGWFFGGLRHRVSSHSLAQLPWGKGPNANMVERNSKGYYELWVVPEVDAKDVIRTKIINAG